MSSEEDAMNGLTLAQRTEVKVRKLKDSKSGGNKPIEQIVEEVKKWWDETREFQGPRIRKDYLKRIRKLAKRSGTTARYELERIFESETMKEILDHEIKRLTEKQQAECQHERMFLESGKMRCKKCGVEL